MHLFSIIIGNISELRGEWFTRLVSKDPNDRIDLNLSNFVLVKDQMKNLATTMISNLLVREPPVMTIN